MLGGTEANWLFLVVETQKGPGPVCRVPAGWIACRTIRPIGGSLRHCAARIGDGDRTAAGCGERRAGGGVERHAAVEAMVAPVLLVSEMPPPTPSVRKPLKSLVPPV